MKEKLDLLIDDEAKFLPLIALIVAGVFIILPIRTFINCCNSADEALES
jgi:hypothetical protein